MIACSAPIAFLTFYLGIVEVVGWWKLLKTLGLIAGLVAWIVASFAGIYLWSYFSLAREKRAGKVSFNKECRIDIGEDGFFVQDLGLMPWSEVLSLENIPDADSALIVHTRPYGALMIAAPVSELIPALRFYLESSTKESLKLARGNAFIFRAIVFRRTPFMALIVLGYVLGIAVAMATALAAPDLTIGKALVLPVLLFMVAYLVWFFPISQITAFAPKRVRVFEINGNRLRSLDGNWNIDLSAASLSYKQSSGIGFNVEYLSIRSFDGVVLNLIIDSPDRIALDRLLLDLELLTFEGRD